MTETPSPKKPGPKKGRSPSYPGVSLDLAVERAKTLYDHERQHEAPLSSATAHWGYAKRSGPGLITVAALHKFGLLDYSGTGESRQVKLTELALEIILNPKPLDAVQRAALEPAIHRDLWEEYGVDLPSDQTLRYKLIRERGFTEVGADEFIPQWKRTIAYAQLGPDVRVTNSEPETEEVEMVSPAAALAKPQAPQIQGEFRNLVLPLLSGVNAMLQVPSALSEEDWDQLLRVLDAMKPGLIATPKPKEH